MKLPRDISGRDLVLADFDSVVRIPTLTRTRIFLAFAISVIADVLQFPINAASATGLFAVPGEMADLALDTVVMIIMSALLGFHWSFLPSFILEAVPGLDLIPTWTGCVAFVVWRRRKAEARAASIQPHGSGNPNPPMIGAS